MDLAGYKPTLSEVAALVGKSSRWVAELRANGKLPPDGATLREFLEAWFEQNAAPKVKATDNATARLITAQADLAEMKAAQVAQTLLPREEVTAAVQAAFARVRAKLLNLPAKSAPAVVTMKSVAIVQEKLTELVHEALDELATTPVVIAAAEAGAEAARGDDRAEPADGGDCAGMVAGTEAAASPDGKPVGRRKTPAKPGSKRRTRKVGHKPG